MVSVTDFTKLLEGVSEDDIDDTVKNPIGEILGLTPESAYLCVESRSRSIVNVCRELGRGVHHALAVDDIFEFGSPEMLSQSDIVRFLLHLEADSHDLGGLLRTGSLRPRLSEFFRTPVHTIATREVENLFTDTPMSIALPLLSNTRCMPVCDHTTKRIVSIISGTDLLGMEAIRLAKREGMTVGEFLLRQNIHGYHAPILVKPADDLRYAALTMMNRHVHCIFVEADRYETHTSGHEDWRWICGVVSMSDIIKEFNKEMFGEFYFSQMGGPRK
jgi:hypothetical protein